MATSQKSVIVSDLEMETALSKHDIEGVVAAFKSDPFMESLDYYRWPLEQRRILFARLQVCFGLPSEAVNP
jgi:hypothetical protein